MGPGIGMAVAGLMTGGYGFIGLIGVKASQGCIWISRKTNNFANGIDHDVAKIALKALAFTAMAFAMTTGFGFTCLAGFSTMQFVTILALGTEASTLSGALAGLAMTAYCTYNLYKSITEQH